MTFRKLTSALVLALGAAFSATSHAAVLLADNFDTDHAGSVLNVATLNNWTISSGTVDYIKQGGFGISCFGGIGGCLDMDGSTGNAGRITSKATFTLLPGTWYYLEAQVSGNQRGGASDSVTFGLYDTDANSDFAFATFGGIPPGNPFGLFSYGQTVANPVNVRLFIEGIGGDNIGVILDNVVFRDESQGVPEPGTLALLGLSLAGLTAARRRRQ